MTELQIPLAAACGFGFGFVLATLVGAYLNHHLMDLLMWKAERDPALAEGEQPE